MTSVCHPDNNLLYFRSILSDPHYVAKPLGRNDDLNRLLVEEYCIGEPLDRVIMRSINNREPGILYEKLTALAYFLAHFLALFFRSRRFFSGDARQFNVLMRLYFSRMQRIRCTTMWADGSCLEYLEAGRTHPNEEIAIGVERFLLLHTSRQTPLNISIGERVSRVITYTIDNFRDLTRLISHRAHSLLPVQCVAFGGSEQQTAGHIINGHTL